MIKKLSHRQRVFVEQYLVDFCGARAAIAAGYSKKSAKVTASRLLTYANVQTALGEAIKQRIERIKVDASLVLHELNEIRLMSIADILNDNHSLKPVSEWPEVWQRHISSYEITEVYEGRGDNRQMKGYLKKLRCPDKLKNLELLGRHTDVKAFVDQVTHKHNLEEEAVVTLKDILRDLDGKTRGLPNR
jgi:phage terminase small subunit